MNHKLFAWGANSHGQLGCGNLDDQDFPVAVNLDINDSLLKITGGGSHSLLLTKNGSIYSCGNNEVNQLGRDGDTTAFREVMLNKSKCKAIACGWDFSLALTLDGSLLTWGSNSFGQLGIDKTCNQISPTLLECAPKRLKSIAAGLRHSAAVTESGSVYAWGFNSKSQLGTPTAISARVICTPNIIDLSGEQIETVVCGSDHSAALSTHGEVFVWGSNRHGQCAQDPKLVKVVTKPQKINSSQFNGDRILNLFSGWTHLVAIGESGRVYTWGRASYGQLGRFDCGESQLTVPQFDHNPTEIPHLTIPHPVNCLEYSCRVVCGSEHCLLISPDTRRLMSWGWNEHGMCGVAPPTGGGDCVWRPSEITALPLTPRKRCWQVGSGAGHSFAIVQCGGSSTS